MRLAGKTVVLCVTGGIAAYKAADLTSKLRQAGAAVRVLMTRRASVSARALQVRLAAVLALAFVMRMALSLFVPGYGVDMGCFGAWADRMALEALWGMPAPFFS